MLTCKLLVPQMKPDQAYGRLLPPTRSPELAEQAGSPVAEAHVCALQDVHRFLNLNSVIGFANELGGID